MSRLLRRLRPVGTIALLISVALTCLSGCSYKTSTAAGRPYYLSGALSGTAKRPLAVVLAGVNSDPADFDSKSGFATFADKHGFAVAYGVERPNGWSAGGCCGEAVTAHTNDMGYLLAMVTDAEKHVPIDTKRVYVIGFSTGGMMAERAACERPDVFAAAGSMSGALLVPCPKGARIVHVHGETDPVVPLSGGYSGWVSFAFPPVAKERTAILTGHPSAAYTLVVLPKYGHGWPTARVGYDATSQIWAKVSSYRL